MRLVNVDTLRLEDFIHNATPRYAILSHTWGADHEELSFHDLQNGNTEKPGIGSTKLRGCCRKAKEDGLGYVWIDTCCIDKTNSVELGEAINSMFRWYQNSVVCYVYLYDVEVGDHPFDQDSSFTLSRWFKRGWTLQELLASSKLNFYDSEWFLLGTKKSLSSILERITGIRRPVLLGIESLRDASVAERMSWAAHRVTKRKEDIAYCLLGIFNITMPMIYGEGDQAFTRLQHAIMRDIDDDSILAWGLDATDTAFDQNTNILLSAGALATSPKDYAKCGHIVSRKHHVTSRDPMSVVGGYLRVFLSVVTTESGQKVGLLNCGPKRDSHQKVVGIPLGAPGGCGVLDEYIRPQGLCPLLISPIESQPPTFVYLAVGRRSNEPQEQGQRLFYLEPSVDTKLELIEVEPQTGWQRDLSLIATTTRDKSGRAEQPTLARFRSRKYGYDFLVVLGFEPGESRPEPQCHLMIATRSLDLKDLHQRLTYLRSQAFGRQTASDGDISIRLTVEPEIIGQRSMFAVRLHTTNDLNDRPDFTAFADFELGLLLERSALLNQLMQADDARDVGRNLTTLLADEISKQENRERRLAKIDEEIRKLTHERQLLAGELTVAAQYVNEISEEDRELKRQEDERSEILTKLRRRVKRFEANPLHQGTAFTGEYVQALKMFFSERGILLRDDQTAFDWALECHYYSVVDLLHGTEVEIDVENVERGDGELSRCENSDDVEPSHQELPDDGRPSHHELPVDGEPSRGEPSRGEPSRGEPLNDGTPIIVPPRSKRQKDQTSLLIEYFEGGKASSNAVDQTSKPSVRVRLTPGNSSRRTSKASKIKDTEEIKRPRQRRPASPLLSGTDIGIEGSHTQSVISSIPPNSFLDGPEEAKKEKSSVFSPKISSSNTTSNEGVRRRTLFKSTIQNPKLLETVEDAIKRLILPDLDRLKAEQSKRDRGIERSASGGIGVPEDTKDRLKGKPLSMRRSRSTPKDLQDLALVDSSQG